MVGVVYDCDPVPFYPQIFSVSIFLVYFICRVRQVVTQTDTLPQPVTRTSMCVLMQHNQKYLVSFNFFVLFSMFQTFMVGGPSSSTVFIDCIQPYTSHRYTNKVCMNNLPSMAVIYYFIVFY